MELIRKATNRYKPLSGYKVVEKISNILKKNSAPLTAEQEKILLQNFGNRGMYGNLGMDFQIYSWEKKPVKSNFLWRITLPLLFIIVLLFKPLLFIFNGTTSFSEESKIGTILDKWYCKIFS